MTYSFNVRAATMPEAVAKARAEFEKVVAQQACHARDQAQALAALDAFAALVPEARDGHEASVSMAGYLSGSWQGTDVVEVFGANVSVAVGFVAKT